ncbi:MAG: hypothetical protein ABGX07_14350 [Pirellulaceae bacterium]|nr:hypothetical protein [Planctomycetaceae bacterium]
MSRFYCRWIVCGFMAVSSPVWAQNAGGAGSGVKPKTLDKQQVQQEPAAAREQKLPRARQKADAARQALVKAQDIGREQQVRQLQANRLASQTRAMNNMKASYDRRLKLAILEIDRVCDLSEEQRKKLQIAAQGAIEAATVKRQAPNAAGAAVFQLAARPVNAVAATRPTSPPTLGTVGERVLSQPLWIKTVENTLTAKQKATLAESEARRATAMRKARIDELTLKLCQTLLLSPEQEVAMRELIDRTTEETNLRYLADRSGESLIRSLSRIPRDEAVKFLGEEQMAFWPAQTALGANTINRFPAQRRAVLAPPPRPAAPKKELPPGDK